MSLLRWFDDHFRWEIYKDLFHITVFRYLVLWFSVVPLIASLLQGLRKPLELTLGGHAFTLALALPFSWELLWVSSLLFIVALMIYQLRCPAFVKKYNNFADYLAYQHDSRWLAHETRFLIRANVDVDKFTEVLLKKRFAQIREEPIDEARNPSVEELQTVFRYTHDGKTIVVASPVMHDGKLTSDADRGLFWEIFARYSGSRAYARLAILVLLTVSGLTFLVVLLQHMCYGTSYVLDWVRQVAG